MSVISQVGNFDLEYIIMDGGSTDGTLEIISGIVGDYQNKKLTHSQCLVRFELYTEKDKGLYDAVSRGIEKSTGEILGYLNADDIYLPGAIEKITEAFNVSNCEWVKGITGFIDEKSRPLHKGRYHTYRRDWLQAGVYGTELYFVEQDSVFWKRSLWHKIKSIPETFKLAGDLWLWSQFAQWSELHTFNSRISCFRKRKGQLSEKLDAYHDEIKKMNLRQLSWLEKTQVFLAKIYFRIKESIF